MPDGDYSVTIRVHKDVLERALAKRMENFKSEMLSDDVKKASAIMYADAVNHLVPMKHGFLRNSITFPKYKGTRAVKYTAPYAEAQHYGYTRGVIRKWTTEGTIDHWNQHLSNADRAQYYEDVKRMLLRKLKRTNNG